MSDELRQELNKIVADSVERAFAHGVGFGRKHAEVLDEAGVAKAASEYAEAFRLELQGVAA